MTEISITPWYKQMWYRLSWSWRFETVYIVIDGERVMWVVTYTNDGARRIIIDVVDDGDPSDLSNPRTLPDLLDDLDGRVVQ